MKAMNEPVTVIAGFSSEGTIQPILFRYLKKEYRVKSLKWWKFGEPVWTNRATRIYCVCTNDDKVAELEWEVDSGVWWLLKMG